MTDPQTTTVRVPFDHTLSMTLDADLVEDVGIRIAQIRGEIDPDGSNFAGFEEFMDTFCHVWMLGKVERNEPGSLAKLQEAVKEALPPDD